MTMVSAIAKAGGRPAQLATAWAIRSNSRSIMFPLSKKYRRCARSHRLDSRNGSSLAQKAAKGPAMTELTVAALQLALTSDVTANIAHVTELVREAAARGAQVILPPELFEGEYFCRVEDEGLFVNAKPVGE